MNTLSPTTVRQCRVCDAPLASARVTVEDAVARVRCPRCESESIVSSPWPEFMPSHRVTAGLSVACVFAGVLWSLLMASELARISESRNDVYTQLDTTGLDVDAWVSHALLIMAAGAIAALLLRPRNVLNAFAPILLMTVFAGVRWAIDRPETPLFYRGGSGANEQLVPFGDLMGFYAVMLGVFLIGVVVGAGALPAVGRLFFRPELRAGRRAISTKP